jgi:hypothetical protein
MILYNKTKVMTTKRKYTAKSASAFLDAFIPTKPFASWLLDETTAQWKAPVDMPTDDKRYTWNEETKFWDEVTV